MRFSKRRRYAHHKYAILEGKCRGALKPGCENGWLNFCLQAFYGCLPNLFSIHPIYGAEAPGLSQGEEAPTPLPSPSDECISIAIGTLKHLTIFRVDPVHLADAERPRNTHRNSSPVDASGLEMAGNDSTYHVSSLKAPHPLLSHEEAAGKP